MNDNEINRLAAEALNICWHKFPEGGGCWRCATEGEALVVADFCTDRNAAARLVEAVDENDLAGVVLDWYLDDGDVSCASIWLLKLPPRTITLACLTALGKISLDEAKEALV